MSLAERKRRATSPEGEGVRAGRGKKEECGAVVLDVVQASTELGEGVGVSDGGGRGERGRRGGQEEEEDLPDAVIGGCAQRLAVGGLEAVEQRVLVRRRLVEVRIARAVVVLCVRGGEVGVAVRRGEVGDVPVAVGDERRAVRGAAVLEAAVRRRVEAQVGVRVEQARVEEDVGVGRAAHLGAEGARGVARDLCRELLGDESVALLVVRVGVVAAVALLRVVGVRRHALGHVRPVDGQLLGDVGRDGYGRRAVRAGYQHFGAHCC